MAVRKVRCRFHRAVVQACDNDVFEQMGNMVRRALLIAFNAAVRVPFRIVGEEIDGSFELDHEVYLLEAKWHEKPSGIDHLYVFREKVGGKSPFTRGAFFSINGITSEAAEALTHGKTPLFYVVNGHVLLMLLEGMLDLTTFLGADGGYSAKGGCAYSSLK
jgi:hypothetical protein